MSRRVEGQGGHRSEGGGGQLQRHRSGGRLITQDTGIPRKPAANPVAEGLNLSGSQLLPGRHVRIGSRKNQGKQAAFFGSPFLHHWPLLAPLEHLLAGQQRKPSLLLGFAVAGKTFIAQQNHRAPSQRITRARRGGCSRQQQHGSPKGSEPESELSWDAVDHGKEESFVLKPLRRQRQPSYHQKRASNPPAHRADWLAKTSRCPAITGTEANAPPGQRISTASTF